MARLKRFMPDGRGLNGKSGVSISLPEDEDEEALSEIDPNSLKGRIGHIMSADPSKGWTVQTMFEHLKQIQFPLEAKTPAASISVAMAKWTKQNRAYIAKKGSGRKPHIYKWRA